jgi:N-acetylmuramoyl-L-alanine amidase
MAQTPGGGAPLLLGLRIEPGRTSTLFHADLSGSTPFHVAAHADPDRVEIDFPGVVWPSSLAASGNGGGLVAVYRRASAPDGGTRIVLETTTAVRIASAGLGLAAPRQPTAFDLEIVSADGSLPPGPPVVAAASAAPQEHFLTVPAVHSPDPPKAAPALSIPVSLLTALPDSPAPTPVAPHGKNQAETRHIVAIDPGHGGIDPGTSGPDGTFEKQITLETGLALKTALEATGHYTVVMTRHDDTFIPLQDRVQIARRAGAELFVSLHCDAMEGRDARGATVYTLSQNASDAVAERLAANENRAAAIGGIKLAGEDDGTANLLIDMSLRESVNPSNRFAELVVAEFGEHNIRLQDLKPHRSAGFAVLKAADMPSVLIEMGYLSDPGDAALLADPRHQRAISQAIIAGMDQYFRAGDGRKS